MKENKNFILTIGCLFCSVFFIYLLQFFNNKDFKNPDLAEEFEYVFDEKYLCEEFDHISNCLSYLKDNNFNKKIVWLGNSQLMVINKPKKGEFTASTLAFNRWKKKNNAIVTFAMPNASLKELYVLFEFFVNNAKIDVFIISLVFDDTRENKIRQKLTEAYDNENVKKQLIKSNVGKTIINNDYNKQDIKKNKSLQSKTENWLNKNVQKCCKWISTRESTQGQISNFLYKLRNYIFNIKPTSIRKIVPGYYKQNISALETILKRSKELGIKTIIYISPIRQDISIPYDLDEYENFKKQVVNLAQKHKSNYLNLEKIVSGDLWGLKKSTTLKNIEEVDFMHFMYQGHKILENAISEKLEIIIE